MKKKIAKFAAFIYIAALVVVTVLFTINDAETNLIREVVIEAGTDIKVEDFFHECPEDAKFVTDVSTIDTDVPAVYKLKVFYSEAFEKDVILKIEDHTGPKGIAIPKMQYASLKWPDAADCVGYLTDISGIAKIEYKNGVPDYQLTGDYVVPVVVTDWYNNSTVIDVPFHVIDDHNAPVFYGIHDINIDNSEDAVIDYFSGISWKDDYDDEPTVRVDTSKVEIGKVGTYTITYIAFDSAGNIRKQDAKVNIKIPDINDSFSGAGGAWDSTFHNEAYAYAMELIEELRGEDDVETARNIFTWVHDHVFYDHVQGTLTYEEAVYQAFSKHSADCYGYYAVCKMLLDCAGIENMMVLRYPVTYNGHYWNLVKLDGEWYHCDSTMFMNHPSLYFMKTDAQIMDSRHSFNGAMLPVRAEGTPEYAY